MSAELELVLNEVRVVFREASVAQAVEIRALLAGAGQPLGDRVRESLARIAHILKGTGGTLGFSVVSRLASDLEVLHRNTAPDAQFAAGTLALAAALDDLTEPA